MADRDNLANATDTLLQPRHRWYFVKEGFSPNLIREAITDSNCQKGDLVIDIFCGGGTAPLTAKMEGFSAIGFEVNPFLAFISRVKMSNCKPRVLNNSTGRVEEGIINGAESNLINFSTFSENGKNKKWLFNREVLLAFEGGWKNTVGMYVPVRDMLRLCLIGAAMDVCNAIRDGKCLRYRENWWENRYGKKDLLVAFSDRVGIVKKDLETNPLRACENVIINADSRDLNINELNGRLFNLCVTSPPYLNSFDYTDVYRPELFLSKLVKSQTELSELRKKTIRSHVQVNWDKPKNIDISPLLVQSITDIKKHGEGLWNNRIPMMVQAYFEDMQSILKVLKSLAAPNAVIWLVVSTSAYAGVEIPVDLIIAHIGSQCGWALKDVKVTSYLRRVPGQQWQALAERKNNNPRLRESIVIFENRSRLKRYSSNGIYLKKGEVQF